MKTILLFLLCLASCGEPVHYKYRICIPGVNCYSVNSYKIEGNCVHFDGQTSCGNFTIYNY